MFQYWGIFIPLFYLFTPWLDFADYTLPSWLSWTGAILFICAAGLLWKGDRKGRLQWQIDELLGRESLPAFFQIAVGEESIFLLDPLAGRVHLFLEPARYARSLTEQTYTRLLDRQHPLVAGVNTRFDIPHSPAPLGWAISVLTLAHTGPSFPCVESVAVLAPAPNSQSRNSGVILPVSGSPEAFSRSRIACAVAPPATPLCHAPDSCLPPQHRHGQPEP